MCLADTLGRGWFVYLVGQETDRRCVNLGAVTKRDYRQCVHVEGRGGFIMEGVRVHRWICCGACRKDIYISMEVCR